MQRNLTGYFGKLPDRADFVTGSCPDGFLKLWEPFLMGGLAQSRQQLGGDWEDAYMTMPIWRFWLKSTAPDGAAAACAAGALMPSVDKVGRKFPLTVVGAPSGAESIGEPPQTWYDDVEAVLLGALEDDATLSGFKEAVAGLAAPAANTETDDATQCGSMVPEADTKGRVTSRFWCQAGAQAICFGCDGLPAPNEFRWLLVPEAFEARSDRGDEAGQKHGRYQAEDHRT